MSPWPQFRFVQLGPAQENEPSRFKLFRFERYKRREVIRTRSDRVASLLGAMGTIACTSGGMFTRDGLP
jgi:hypothetical protein